MAKRIKHRGGLPPDRYLSTDEIGRLIRTTQRSAASGGIRGAANLMIVELLLGSGLRASELTALKMRDLPANHNKPLLFVRLGKGRISRTVSISTALAKKLTQFIKLYRPNAKPGSPLFRSERGFRRISWVVHRGDESGGRKKHEDSSRLTYASLYSKIRRLGKRAGISGLSPHKLRHTHLCVLYATAKDIRNVQDQAGHASPATTAIYARTSEPARRQQIEAVETALNRHNF